VYRTVTRVLPNIACLTLLAWTAAAQPQPDAEHWAILQQSNETSRAFVDHSRWQQFLDSYVETNTSDINLARHTEVTDVDRERLRTCLGALQTVDPRDFQKQQQRDSLRIRLSLNAP
jgi:hypothetical protein